MLLFLAASAIALLQKWIFWNWNLWSRFFSFFRTYLYNDYLPYLSLIRSLDVFHWIPASKKIFWRDFFNNHPLNKISSDEEVGGMARC